MSGSEEAEGPARVGNVLPGLLRKWGIASEVRGQRALEAWPEAVGERIASVSRAVAVSRGVLFVEVRSSAWMAELTLMRGDLLEQLNAGLGEASVERLVFRLAESDLREGDPPSV